MTAAAATQRTLAFGDLEGAVWGIAWIPDPDRPGFAALASGDRALTVEAGLGPQDGGDEWLLHGYGVELTASDAGEISQDLSGEFEAICRVQGEITLDGIEHEIACLGRLAAHADAGDLDRFESIRDVSAWFDPVHGLSLTAMRPRKARGQEADVVHAVALEPEGPVMIGDPRLSTTYSSDGRPLRVGLELWVDGDDEQDQFPRRATGMVTGSAARGHVDGFDVLAQFVRWDSRYGEGAGVYLLAQRA